VSAPFSVGHIISRTALRIFVASLIFQFASLAGDYAAAEAAMVLCWIWAFHHVYAPLGLGIRWLFREWRQAAARRRLRETAVAHETKPVPLSQWGLHE
jgi:hypothetical protein